MDFQYLLELAAKNQENAEKKLTVTKRYSTKVPPPKKLDRPTVDPNAIRAKIEQKEKEKIQKAEQVERERIEGLKRQAEAEKKKKKERKSRSPKKSASSSASREKETVHSSSEESGRRQEQPQAELKENAQAHRSFMRKIEREAERRREQEARRDAESRPAKPKSIKKSAPVPKKPMSFEELMKFAKNQQHGGGMKSAPANREEEVEEVDDDEEEDKREYKKSGKGLDRRENHNAVRKGQSFKPNGENVRTKTMQKDQAKGSISSGSGNQTKQKLSAGVEKGGVLGKERRTNGEVISKEKSVKQIAERQNLQSRNPERPSTSGKSKPRPSEKSSGSSTGKVNTSRPSERPTSSVKQGDNRLLAGKQSEKPSSRPHPKQSERSAGGSSSLNRIRPGERPLARPEDGPRAKLDARPTSGQRPPRDDHSRPRSSGMGPPRSQEAPRKRPAPSQQPMRMKVKQGRLCSDSEESDYDDGDGFIDDTPLEDMDCTNVSSYIKEIFGYDKSKYGYESDYALKFMDASYRDIQKEESRSARLGMLEDLEDMRKEKEENRRKAIMKKGKKR